MTPGSGVGVWEWGGGSLGSGEDVRLQQRSMISRVPSVEPSLTMTMIRSWPATGGVAIRRSKALAKRGASL